MMRSLWCVLVVLLAGCTAQSPRLDTAAGTTAGADVAALTQAQCQAQGGTWGPMGRAQVAQCLMPTSDAGRACTDSAQCQGQCLATEGSRDGQQVHGTCSVDTNRFGCQQRVRDGVAWTICVD